MTSPHIFRVAYRNPLPMDQAMVAAFVVAETFEDAITYVTDNLGTLRSIEAVDDLPQQVHVDGDQS